MSDSQRGDGRGGRGRGRGRGRGDDLGGRGRGRGRGDDQGSRGRGRGRGDGEGVPSYGGFQQSRGEPPDRGQFRGSGRGHPIDDRGWGRGPGGGNRGHPRGFPDKFAGQPQVFGAPSKPPSADEYVTKLEDAFFKKNVSTQLAKLAVGEVETFPARPAFGTRGIGVTLWANYFALTVQTKELFKYTITVPDPRAAEAKPEKAETEKKAGSAADEAKKVPEVVGKKRKLVIADALRHLGDSVPIATELKSQLISLEALDLPEDRTIHVQLNDARSRGQIFAVEFNGPTVLSITDLLTFLRDFVDPNNIGGSFPKFSDTRESIGIVLGHTPRSSSTVHAFGRSRFYSYGLSKETRELGLRGLDAIRGYFQSVRPATGRLLLNAQVTHGVVHRPEHVSGLIKRQRLNLMGSSIMSIKGYQWQSLKQLSRLLSGLRVQVTVRDDKNNDRVVEKTISGLASLSDGKGELRPQFQNNCQYGGPFNVKFYMKATPGGGGALPGDQYYKVADYFNKKYNIQLDPSMPLLNVGTAANPVYQPAERCVIMPGQIFRGKINSDETRGMIEFACRSPYANATSVATSGRETLSLDSNGLLAKFGISVGKELITVKGRELPLPQIVYLDKTRKIKEVRALGGTWNMVDVRVVRPGRRINTWAWAQVTFDMSQDKELSGHVRAFSEFIINSMGVNMNPRPIDVNGLTIPITDTRRNPQASRNLQQQRIQEVDRAFSRLKGNGSYPEIVFVVLAGEDTEVYNAIKILADCKYGFHTVCAVKSKFLKKRGQDIVPNMSYFANVALKFNLKFGGVNHRLKDNLPVISGGKTMVVGYDVTHPTNMGADADNVPSLVGLVASIDKDLGQWPSVAWHHGSRVEMLDIKLVDAFASRIALWRRHNNNQIPENIIIYRDGVSEGQFSQVVAIELPRIRQACAKFGKQPKISLIVSVKRHQTRFYPTNPSNMDGKSRNVKNGTVVDRGVTQVQYWDFFLTAHTALQGTARPAHYTVLIDEIFRSTFKQNAANELERLTHELCYLFGRATKAVSICPPAYYADILCTRARVHMAEVFDGTESMSSTEGGLVTSRQVHEKLKDSMYYL